MSENEALNFNRFAEAMHKIAVEHGWWEQGKRRTVGDLLMLMVTELSEAFQQYRISGNATEIVYVQDKETGGVKPEGVPIDFADLIIRLGDVCAGLGIDLEKAIKIKVSFNIMRPYRHGGKAV